MADSVQSRTEKLAPIETSDGEKTLDKLFGRVLKVGDLVRIKHGKVRDRLPVKENLGILTKIAVIADRVHVPYLVEAVKFSWFNADELELVVAKDEKEVTLPAIQAALPKPETQPVLRSPYTHGYQTKPKPVYWDIKDVAQ